MAVAEAAVRLDATSHKWAVVAGCCEQQEKRQNKAAREREKTRAA